MKKSKRLIGSNIKFLFDQNNPFTLSVFFKATPTPKPSTETG